MNLFALHPGQHDCVTVINNFFSRAKLELYTRPQGQEQEPKLPPKLAGPLHKIIMTTNLNPVKVRAAGGGTKPTSCDICGACGDLLVTPSWKGPLCPLCCCRPFAGLSLWFSKRWINHKLIQQGLCTVFIQTEAVPMRRDHPLPSLRQNRPF